MRLIFLWIVSIRVGDVTEKLFNKADQSLVAVRGRVVQTKDRVAAAKISTNDLEKMLRNWTKLEVKQRVALNLNARERTERLASSLRQADDWLAVSVSSVDLVQEMLSMSASAGAPTDTTLVDELRGQIESLRAQLAEATEFVGRIQERIAALSDGKSPEERIEQAVQFALRVVTTLGSIGPRLEKLADRFSVAASQLQEMKDRTQRYRLYLTMGITLLMIWMAAGQAALSRLAWNGCARRGLPSNRNDRYVFGSSSRTINHCWV